jgi:hypothetical protein
MLMHRLLQRFTKLSAIELLVAVLFLIGTVFIWRGSWLILDSLPILSDPWVSVIVGALILLVAQRFINME